MEEETTPNISSMSDEELRELIDLLRAELVNRLRDDHSDVDSLIKGDDVERLSQILSGNTEPPTKPPS